MPTIALICDSTADVPEHVRHELDVQIVPLNVHFGDEVLHDYVDVSPSAFLRRLETTGELPRSSQPSPALFTAAFETAAKNHDAICVVTISSKLSGTHQSVLLAAQSSDLAIPIRIVDSLSASIGLGLQVERARSLVDAGVTIDELAQTLEQERDRYHLIFFADTLEYLQRGGRIGKASQLLGSLLKIKPLLRCLDGEVVPYERTRTRSGAIDGLIEFARQFPAIDRIAIMHDGTTSADVDTLLNGIGDRVPESAITVSQYGPIIATHVGPRALGLCVFEGPG